MLNCSEPHGRPGPWPVSCLLDIQSGFTGAMRCDNIMSHHIQCYEFHRLNMASTILTLMNYLMSERLLEYIL